MTGGVLGGGVIFVVVALLWAAVLVPAWTRRREFRAAERNALRIQRTIRVLAETTEVPQEVRLEATAKQALAQEKLLRTAQKRQDAEREAEFAEARAEQMRAEIRAQQMQRRQAAAQRAARLRRPVVRRVRAVAALAALGGSVGVLVGVGFAIGGSGSAVLLWSAACATVGVGALVLLAPGRARTPRIAAEQVVLRESPGVEAISRGDIDETDAGSRAAQAHAAAQQAAAERMERARALARARAARPAARPAARENQTDSMLLREAREQVSRARTAESVAGTAAQAVVAPESTPTESGAAAARRQATRDRLRQMGVIGDTSEGMPDLDAVLRRRRNAS